MKDTKTKISEELFRILKKNDFKEEVVVELFKQLSQKNNFTQEKTTKTTKEDNVTRMLCESLKYNLDELKPSVFSQRSLKEQLKQTGQNFINHLHLNHPNEEVVEKVSEPECHTLVHESTQMEKQTGISCSKEKTKEFCVKGKDSPSHQQLTQQPPSSSSQQQTQQQPSSSSQQLTQQQPSSSSQQLTQHHNDDDDVTLDQDSQQKASDSLLEMNEQDQQILMLLRQSIHQDDRNFTESNQEETKIQQDELEKQQDCPEKTQQNDSEKLLQSNKPPPIILTPHEYSKATPSPNSPPQHHLPSPFITSILKDLTDEQPELVNIFKTSKPRSLPSLLRHLNLLTHHVTLCEKVLKQKMASAK